MQISKFTDYSFRILIYLARNRDGICIIDDIALELSISKDHLKKVVNKLAKSDYIISTKGRNGGLKLGTDPKDINLGEVFKLTEENLSLVECMNSNRICTLVEDGCRLKDILSDSLNLFIEELSKHTLQDIL